MGTEAMCSHSKSVRHLTLFSRLCRQRQTHMSAQEPSGDCCFPMYILLSVSATEHCTDGGIYHFIK